MKNQNLHARTSSESSALRAIPDRIELFAIERLIPSARNARTHSEQQIAELAGSMRAFGFMVPVLVDAEAGLLPVTREFWLHESSTLIMFP